MTFLAFPNIVPPNEQTKFESYPGYEWAYRLTQFAKTIPAGGGEGGPVSITATPPLKTTPNPITGVGDVEHLDSGVVAGTYGDATDIPSFTVTAKGHLTFAANNPLGGINNPIQASLANLTFRAIKTTNSTTPSTFGITMTTNAGTVTHPALNNANMFKASEYNNYQTAAAKPNQANYMSVGAINLWRGNNTLLGGFLLSYVVGGSVVPAGYRAMFGAAATTASNLGNVEPSSLVNCFFLGCDSTDTNYQIMVNDGSGTCTKTDTGFSCTTALTDIFRVKWQCDPDSTTLNCMVIRLNDNTTFGPIAITSNLPDPSLFMCIRFEVNNGATGGAGSACAFGFCSLYMQAIV